ncbi:MAG: protein kinase [Gemmatimonadaceae bacterium]|nr:protein kinase [Gemmatimonadaceae bacterium]
MSDAAAHWTEGFAGRHRVERELGRGGMATVLLAQDVRHGRPVAIKVLSAEIADLVSADRFLQEIRLLASLQHPHIVPLFDSGSAHGLPQRRIAERTGWTLAGARRSAVAATRWGSTPPTSSTRCTYAGPSTARTSA